MWVPQAEVTCVRRWSHAEVQGRPCTLAVPASPFGERSALCAFGCKHATRLMCLCSKPSPQASLDQFLCVQMLSWHRVSQRDGDTQPPWSTRASVDGSRRRWGVLHPRGVQGILPDCGGTVLRLVPSSPAPECCHPSGEGSCGAGSILLFGRANRDGASEEILICPKSTWWPFP